MFKILPYAHFANISVEGDRLQAAHADSLRGFAAAAAPHVERYGAVTAGSM